MSDEFVQASMYDKMINWQTRLEREIPVIAQYFEDLGEGASILDVACSSGRHSFALNKLGFQTVGVDVSASFIKLANQLKTEFDSNLADLSEFVEINAADKELIHRFDGRYFDGAILLGNAIANMGNFHAGRQLLRNIFALLRPGGKLFVQTVNKPHRPWYNPLRRKDDIIIQRIMIPDPPEYEDSDDHLHNMVLHVNQIDANSLEYISQKTDNLFFMYRLDEFQRLLLQNIGFEIKSIKSGYSGAEVQDIDGETLIWELEKPELIVPKEGLALFDQYNGMIEEEIREKTLSLWQKLVAENWYHCIRSYRFLYPRITSNPRYTDFVNAVRKGPMLDIACFVGTDLRQLWVDGVRGLHGLDISDIFISAGKELFDKNIKKEGFEIAEIEFHVADITDSSFLIIEQNNMISKVSGNYARFYEYFAGIHAGSLLHLLNEKQVEDVTYRIYHMLDDDGIFFGRMVGFTTPGYHDDNVRFFHSVESLRSLFNLVGFSDVDVYVMPSSGPEGESSDDRVFQMGFYVKK